MNPTLITTDEQLRSFIPNVQSTVKGEQSLFDKMQSFLATAETWVTSTFAPIEILLSSEISQIASNLVAIEAYRKALPSIDLLLTANGFAAVSTQNLAPASKARIDRLVASLTDQRDNLIASLLTALADNEQWISTSQAAFFGATLFPDFAILDATGITERKWEEYLRLRSQIIDLEASLAEEWFSPELMAELRQRNLQGEAEQHEQTLITAIQSQILGYLRNESFNSRRLADIVNYIRINPDKFHLWHNSETSKLFSPPKFVNKKESSGYFF